MVTATSQAVVAVVARLLADRPAGALPEVLAAIRTGLGAQTVALRGSDGSVTVAAPPDRTLVGRWSLDVPVRRRGSVRGVLSATFDRPLAAAEAAALTTLAHLLAVAGGDEAPADPGRLVLDAEADRAQDAAALLDALGESLVSVRYASELVAAGRLDPAVLHEAVRAAAGSLRAARRDLRANALHVGLRAALAEIAARVGGDRPADGRPALDLSVEASEPALDALSPPVAVVVERVAEAALRGASGTARVSVRQWASGVKLTVECADIGYDASELQRWGRRAAVLGGQLRWGPAGVELELDDLPAQPTQREGHHDDRPDLRRPSAGS